MPGPHGPLARSCDLPSMEPRGRGWTTGPRNLKWDATGHQGRGKPTLDGCYTDLHGSPRNCTGPRTVMELGAADPWAGRPAGHGAAVGRGTVGRGTVEPWRSR